MMNTTGPAYAFILLWGLHIFSVVAFFTGLFLLVAWAIKTFTAAQLKQWAISLMIIGTIVCLFTIGVRGGPWIGFGGFGPRTGMMMQQQGMMERMMDRMMEHDEGSSVEDRLEHEAMEEMMREMMGGKKAMQQ